MGVQQIQKVVVGILVDATNADSRCHESMCLGRSSPSFTLLQITYPSRSRATRGLYHPFETLLYTLVGIGTLQPQGESGTAVPLKHCPLVRFFAFYPSPCLYLGGVDQFGATANLTRSVYLQRRSLAGRYHALRKERPAQRCL
jgi:hypothetical protein